MANEWLLDMEECKHQWVYAGYALMSCPAQHPKICSVCGKESVDHGGYDTGRNYDEIVKKFSKAKGENK